ncbi:LytTR family transcriptional regulator [Ruminococcaceae bacterium OttesenSCG-928-D13]|nr:LytTR family transcriptional regulator [Ruminococcaceae bacterium OttesenSCG-928-D13]
MKVVIELDESLPEDELRIRCPALTDEVRALQRQLAAAGGQGVTRVVFYKEDQEFFFPLDEVLFFETEGEVVWAHTPRDAYSVKFRLYELEEFLPRQFIRVAKSTIVNTAKIYSIKRNLTSSSQVSFADTHKQVYASRHYYNALKQRILERSR